MPSNIQFTSKDDVISAYKSMKMPAWAIWCGKALNFAYTGDNMATGESELASYLEMLDRNPTNVYYMLAMYDDLDGKNITSKTEWVRSFNFRLEGEGMGMTRYNDDGGLGGLTVKQYLNQTEANRLLLSELKLMKESQVAMAKKLEELEVEEETEEDYGLGKIGKVLQHPTIAPMAQQLIGKIIALIPQPPAGGQRIAGVPITDTSTVSALEILNAAVPDFPAVLSKLALLAQRKPESFRFYVDTLRSMEI
jgi:hypothetical protein